MPRLDEFDYLFCRSAFWTSLYAMLISAPSLPRPSKSVLEQTALRLERALGGSKVLVGEATLPFSKDESDVLGPGADIVVLAHSAGDVAETLRIAEAEGVPVTPRAGGTGRSGGAVPAAGGIVLATHPLARIKEIDRRNLVAVVEPGMITGALHAAVEAEGLFYPPDPNSLQSCMIGGNVAENAGGPRAFKYGVTREYVLGLEAVLMGGTVLRPGRRTVKGVTGYDVTALLVGSEGTLAVFTEVTLRLVRAPEGVATLLALYTDSESALAAVQGVVEEGLVPRCMEFMDGRTLDALRAQKVAVDARAGAMLLVELDGAARELQVEQVGEVLARGPGSLEVFLAKDAAERARLWEARRALSPATRKLAKYKLAEDVVVPRSEMGELCRRVDAIGERTGIRHLTYGHAGDGNLHVNWLWDDDSERARVDDSLRDLMQATVELGGTLSGEHGIGVTKMGYLQMEQSNPLIELQRRIKGAFDPRGLLNPGKIFHPTGHGLC